jgi:hypothetical protein
MKHLTQIFPSVAITYGFLSIFLIIPTYANEIDIPNASSIQSESREAGILSTEPATISNKWDNLSDTYDGKPDIQGVQTMSETIPLIRDPECGKINPLELLENPASFFRECHSFKDEQPIPVMERIKYFEVPKLDSGIRVNIGKF